MKRYEIDDDALYQPGSNNLLLRNRPGITDPAVMDRTELIHLVLAQQRWFRQLEPTSPITATIIREMHRDWLGEIYDWAGDYRTVTPSRGGFRWPPANKVAEGMERLESDLLDKLTPCRAGDVGDLANKLAAVHGELLFVHPFLDGNGRLARWLADIMALQAGWAPPAYPFSSSGDTPEKSGYVSAVRQAYSGKTAALEAFFRRALISSNADPSVSR